jgi:ligand-binding sensor domain-containing protein
MRHFLLLTLSILVLQISAQEYSFKLFTNKEGVQGVELLAITQDGKGFLWTGGAFGFNRFDGFVFENFNEANGLANNTVYGINEDSKGKIWVSTTNGISCFNGKNFKNYLQSSTNPQIFFNTIETSKHGLIAYGVGGIYKFTNDSFIRILPELNNVRAIVTNKKGDLFIGTKSGLYLYDGKTLQNQSINEHLVSKSITCLCFDKDQNLWMGTTKGIACALEDGSVKTYYTEQLASNIIRDVKFNDNYGVIFLSDGGDVKIFKNGVFKEISLRPLLSAGNGTRLVVDKESVIWISSTGGLIKMTKNDFIK